MKRIFVPLLAAVVGGVIAGAFLMRGTTERLTPMKGRIDVVESNSDPELAAAVLRARRELPRFVQALQKPTPKQRGFAVNAKFSTPRGFEQIWVTVSAYEKGVFQGKIANDPVALVDRKKGDPVQVPEATVSDWIFQNGDKIAGGYTMQVLLRRQGGGK